jgi:hypothetical protein
MIRASRPLVLAFLVTGCFSYLPVTSVSDVEPGISVRARISPSASAQIAPLLGATDARRLDGTLISQSPDTLIVEVPIVMQDAREFGHTPNQRISIARRDLLELEVRRLDRFRTGAIAGGAAVVIGGLLVNSLKGEPGKEPLPGGGGTDALVFWFRWPPD